MTNSQVRDAPINKTCLFLTRTPGVREIQSIVQSIEVLRTLTRGAPCQDMADALKKEWIMNFEQIKDEVVIVATRSRGPGGQNVNKVSSAAQLFWHYPSSRGLSEQEKAIVGGKLINLINNENQIYLRADEYRDLERNKTRVIEKLEMFLTKALHKPKPRKATRPTRASKLKKKESKSQRSAIKQNRRKPSWDD
jgi:ribosome-associated protein